MRLNQKVTIRLTAEGARYLAHEHQAILRMVKNGRLTLQLDSLIAIFGPCFESLSPLPFEPEIEIAA